MKIAFMLYDSPNNFCGPTINARRLLPELQKRGHDVHAMILFHGEYASTKDYFQSLGIRCHIISRPQIIESQITWILKQLQQINPDIFFANNVLSAWYASKWIQKAGIPAIAAHRSDDPYYWGMVRQFVVGLPDWSVAGLICVSEEIKQKIENFQPKSTQLCVIPSGVPVPKIVPTKTDYYLKIAYVGRLVERQKRIRDTLEALIKVAKTFPKIKITLFGEGKERPYLEKQVKQADLNQVIHFAGGVPSEELHQQLAQYHVLVLLSDYEGTPGAVMDGMGCGLVPICTDIPGGVQELVIPHQTGFLVRDRTEDFQKAIQTLYENSELRIQLSKNAREHIINKYSLLATVNQWESFLQKLLKEAPQRSSIRIPWKYNLPPIREELKAEDHRFSSLWKQGIQKINLIKDKIKSKILF